MASITSKGKKKRQLVDEKQQALNEVNVPNENSYMKEAPKETACGIDDVEEIPASVPSVRM